MKELYKALADFQQEIPTIFKDSTAGQGNFKYAYADLPTIFGAINPLMKKHGLGFTQSVNGTGLCTKIFHVKSGESIESCADIPQGVELRGMNPYQTLGSAITYMRRYQLSAMLGLVTDKDTDAGGEHVKPKSPQKETMNATHPNWDKCVKYLRGAGSITELEKKYIISDDVKEKLIAQTLG